MNLAPTADNVAPFFNRFVLLYGPQHRPSPPAITVPDDEPHYHYTFVPELSLACTPAPTVAHSPKSPYAHIIPRSYPRPSERLDLLETESINRFHAGEFKQSRT